MKILKVLGIAAVAGLLSGLATPVLAQSTPPEKMPVPNSSTVIKCNPNGTGTATNDTNAETSTTNNVPGTPVTQVNPSGQGTATSQTPMLQKPVKPTVQCAKTQQNAAPAMSQGRVRMMNAMTSNPNGMNWYEKYNRPMIAATHKTKRMHRAKHATGGGGY